MTPSKSSILKGAVAVLLFLIPNVARAQDDASVESHTFPATVACGQSFVSSVTMLNTGTTTWTYAGLYKLSPVGDSDPFREGSARVRVPQGVEVEPGDTWTFDIDMEAPTEAGDYFTDWRMIKEGPGGRFGETASRTIEVVCSDVDDASVVSHTLPATIGCGATFVSSVTMLNTGTTTWTYDGLYKLSPVGDSDPFRDGSARVRVPQGVEVEPGDSWTFDIDMEAPTQAGDYFTDWRMIKEGPGGRFGEIASRTVEVVCSDIDDAAVVSHTLPDVVACGQSFVSTVTMLNTGTTTWTYEGLYKLSPVGDSDPFRDGSARVRVPQGVSVEPGESWAFDIEMEAPADPGDYFSDWRMIKEGPGGRFGETASRTIEVACGVGNDAIVSSHTLPAALACGQTYTATVTMTNTGGTVWSFANAYKLGAVGGSDPLRDNNRVYLPQGVTISPGESHTFGFELQAPAEAGDYLTDWRMLQEQVEWFGGIASRTVAVQCGGPGAPVVHSAEPVMIPAGQATVVEVTGDNLTDALSFATETTSGDPAPTVTVLGTSPDGRSMDVRIVPPAGGDGFFDLVVENQHGYADSALRLGGAAPIVDAWSPSQLGEDELYVALILGENLQGASLTASHAGVTIVDVESQPNQITAAIQADPSTPSTVHLIVQNGSGSVSLPVEVGPPGFGAELELRSFEGEIVERPRGGPLAMKLQNLTLTESARQAFLDEQGGGEGGSRFPCGSYTWRAIEWERTFVVSLDINTGRIGRGLLLGMIPGEVRRFTTAVFRSWASVVFSILVQCDPFPYDVDFCVHGEWGVTIPLIEGERCYVGDCTGGGQAQYYCEGLVDFGRMTSFNYGNNQCIEIIDEAASTELGIRTAEARQIGCCAEDVVASGTVSGGPVPGSFPPIKLAETDPLCDSDTAFDYTAIAYVSEPPLRDLLWDLAPGTSTLLKSGLNSPLCGPIVGSWVLGVPSLIGDDHDARYANVFLLANSANNDPPSQIAPQAYLSSGNYRLFSWYRGTVANDGSIDVLRAEAVVGKTPDPCRLTPNSSPEEHPTNRLETASGDGRYLLAQGRVGTLGQMIDTTLNDCGVGFPSTFCPHWPGSGATTPWIWQALRIDSEGDYDSGGGDFQIFPSYSVYSSGFRIDGRTQSNPFQFVDLDDSSQFVDTGFADSSRPDEHGNVGSFSTAGSGDDARGFGGGKKQRLSERIAQIMEGFESESDPAAVLEIHDLAADFLLDLPPCQFQTNEKGSLMVGTISDDFKAWADAQGRNVDFELDRVGWGGAVLLAALRKIDTSEASDLLHEAQDSGHCYLAPAATWTLDQMGQDGSP